MSRTSPKDTTTIWAERSGISLESLARGFTRLLLVAGLGLLIASCDSNPEIIPKDEVKSPDGYWVVKTQLERWSGPGNNYLDSSVTLARAKGQEKPQEILSLDIPTDDLGDVVVTWRDSHHLELGYRKGAKVTFQVVKCADLEISATRMAF